MHWPVVSPAGIVSNSDRVFVSASADLLSVTLEVRLFIVLCFKDKHDT